MKRLLLASLVLVSTSAFAQGWNTIHLKPGQCVLVGNQQVCAMVADACGQVVVVPTQIPLGPGRSRFSCKYGVHKDAEVTEVKTYAVIEDVTYDNGSKETHFIKGYGMADKASCEKDAETRSAEAKAAATK